MSMAPRGSRHLAARRGYRSLAARPPATSGLYGPNGAAAPPAAGLSSGIPAHIQLMLQEQSTRAPRQSMPAVQRPETGTTQQSDAWTVWTRSDEQRRATPTMADEILATCLMFAAAGGRQVASLGRSMAQALLGMFADTNAQSADSAGDNAQATTPRSASAAVLSQVQSTLDSVLSWIRGDQMSSPTDRADQTTQPQHPDGAAGADDNQLGSLPATAPDSRGHSGDDPGTVPADRRGGVIDRWPALHGPLGSIGTTARGSGGRLPELSDRLLALIIAVAIVPATAVLLAVLMSRALGG